MEFSELLKSVPQVGRLEWIGRAAARRAPIQSTSECEVTVDTGLEGEHHARSGKGRRQVTLLQAEHLATISALCGREVEPGDMRRNLLVRGINLIALKQARFSVGEVVLRGTGPCDPCSRIEETLGPGGYHAARGLAGITATVERGGTLRLGDEVRLLESEATLEGA